MNVTPNYVLLCLSSRIGHLKLSSLAGNATIFHYICFKSNKPGDGNSRRSVSFRLKKELVMSNSKIL